MAKSTAEIIAEETPKKDTASIIKEEAGNVSPDANIAQETGPKSTAQIIAEEGGDKKAPKGIISKTWDGMKFVSGKVDHAVGGVGGAVLGWGFRPFAPVKKAFDQAAPAVESLLNDPNPVSAVGGSQFVPGPSTQNGRIIDPLGHIMSGDMTSYRDTPVGEGTSPNTVTPEGNLLLPNEQPYRTSSAGAAIARPGWKAIEANSEGFASPFGVATFPLRMIPVAGKALSTLALETLGADTALGAGLVNTGRIASKAAVSIARTEAGQKGLEAANVFVHESTPGLAKMYHRFVYPAALSFANSVMGQKVIAEKGNTVDLGIDIFNKVPNPLERQKIFNGMREAEVERRNALTKRYEEAMEGPGKLEPMMGVDVGPTSRNNMTPSKEVFRMQNSQQLEHYMDWVDQTDKAKAARKMTINEYTASLPDDVNALISANAKAKGLSFLSPESKEIAEMIWRDRVANSDRLLRAQMATKEDLAVTADTFTPAYYANRKQSLGPLIEGSRVGSRAPLTRLKGKELFTTEERVKAGEVESLVGQTMRARSENVFDGIVGEWAQDIRSKPNLCVTTEEFLANPRKYAGWQPVSESEGWGVLNHTMVHPSVKLEMDGIAVYGKGIMPSFLRGVQNLMGRFKSGATVYSLPCHFGNNVSNPIQVDMIGVPLDAASLLESWKQFSEGVSPAYKIAEKAGHVSPAFMRGKDVRKLIDTARANAEGGEGGIVQALDNMCETLVSKSNDINLSDLAPRAYQGSEEFWKFHTIRTTLERGLPLQGVEAGDIAGALRMSDKAVFNYGEVPIGVYEVRSGPLGALVTPFITYTWKVTPLVVDTLLRNPVVFMKWKALFEASNAASRQIAGVSDQDWENYRQARLLSAGSETEKMLMSLYPEMVMPFRGPGGRIMVMGVARLTPWGQALDPRGLGLLGPVSGPIVGAITGSDKSSWEAGAPDEKAGISITPSPAARVAGKLAMSGATLLPGGATTGKLISNALSLLPSVRGPMGEATSPETYLKDALGIRDYVGTPVHSLPLMPEQRVSNFVMGSMKAVSAEDEKMKALQQGSIANYQFRGGSKAQMKNKIQEIRAKSIDSVPPINAQPWKGNAYSPYTGQPSPIKDALLGKKKVVPGALDR